MKYFKETEGGQEIICQVFEELSEKRVNERAEIVREETRIETLFNSIKNLMASMKWIAEQHMAASVNAVNRVKNISSNMRNKMIKILGFMQ